MRRRRGIAARKLSPGGDAQALLHRRHAIAVLDVDDGTVEAGIAQPLFKTCGYDFAYGAAPVYAYDNSADGQRFLINCLVEETTMSTVTVVVNWRAVLKR